jgi:CRISPR type IV-associated protein Csf3
MEPLTVRAYLASPCSPSGPLLIDAILFAGLGASMQLARPDEDWIPQDEVFACSLPLARVETPAGWWWAASQATPEGPESMLHAHRRPMSVHAEVWTTAKTLNQASGPDKALRVPVYTRPRWLVPTWTCVGDIDEVAFLLAHVPGVGKRITHGFGWVSRWLVVRGGPPVENYARDVRLRHLPVELAPDLPSRVARRRMALRPPYYDRCNAVPCFQVPEAS